MKVVDFADIKRLRKELGITQTELARAAKVSQSLIARIEKNKVDPRYSKVKAIFDALSGMTEKKEEIKAGDIMSTKVIGIQKNDLVGNATNIMKKSNISQMPVFDKDKVIGSISEKTLISRMTGKITFEELSTRRVSEIMDDVFPSVSKETPLSVISNLLEHSVAVLVMDGSSVVGLITKADLLKFVHR